MTLPFFVIIIFWRFRNFFDVFDDVISNCYFFIFMYTVSLLMFLIKKNMFYLFYFNLLLFIYLFIYLYIYLFIYLLIRIPRVTPKN